MRILYESCVSTLKMASSIHDKISSLVQIPYNRITKLDEMMIRDICEYYSKIIDQDDLLFWVGDVSPSIVENIFDDIIRKDMKKYNRFKRLFYTPDDEDVVDMFEWFDSLSR